MSVNSENQLTLENLEEAVKKMREAAGNCPLVYHGARLVYIVGLGFCSRDAYREYCSGDSNGIFE